jgi:hypothetical protein
MPFIERAQRHQAVLTVKNMGARKSRVTAAFGASNHFAPMISNHAGESVPFHDAHSLCNWSVDRNPSLNLRSCLGLLSREQLSMCATANYEQQNDAKDLMMVRCRLTRSATRPAGSFDLSQYLVTSYNIRRQDARRCLTTQRPAPLEAWIAGKG